MVTCSRQMYSVTINGVTIQCQTPAEAVRLAGEIGALNGAAQPAPTAPTAQATTPPSPPSPPPAPAAQPVQVLPTSNPQVVMAVSADEAQAPSKWTEPAKLVIAALVEAGADGLHNERIAEIAGLNGPKGSPPLLRAIIELLGIDAAAIKRVRSDEGKRWVLAPRGVKAAKRLGLLPEAGRP